MNDNIQDAIKNLINLCKLESLQTKDLVSELSELFDKVKNLEEKVAELKERKKEILDEKEKCEYRLSEFKNIYVTPVDKIKADNRELEKQKFKFEVEKVYMEREVNIYKEIICSLTSKSGMSESFNSGGNGAYWNKSFATDRPRLPDCPKFKDENEND